MSFFGGNKICQFLISHWLLLVFKCFRHWHFQITWVTQVTFLLSVFVCRLASYLVYCPFEHFQLIWIKFNIYLPWLRADKNVKYEVTDPLPHTPTLQKSTNDPWLQDLVLVSKNVQYQRSILNHWIQRMYFFQDYNEQWALFNNCRPWAGVWPPGASWVGKKLKRIKETLKILFFTPGGNFRLAITFVIDGTEGTNVHLN